MNNDDLVVRLRTALPFGHSCAALRAEAADALTYLLDQVETLEEHLKQEEHMNRIVEVARSSWMRRAEAAEERVQVLSDALAELVEAVKEEDYPARFGQLERLAEEALSGDPDAPAN